MRLRRSRRPDKQLLWFFIRRDALLGESKKTGLDVGCSIMANKEFFLTDEYIGLDINKEELIQAKKKYPDAKIIHGSLFDAPYISADFVQCIEVFLNVRFDKERAVEAVKKLTSFVKKDGSLLLNIGDQTTQYCDEIRLVLESSFKKVEMVHYGNFNIDKCPALISLLIGGLMYKFPFFTRLSCRDRVTVYFKCIEKKHHKL